MATKTRSTRTSRLSWRRFIPSAYIAAGLNLLLFVSGSFAGADWLANGLTVTWYITIAATLIPLFIGAGVTRLLENAWRNAVPVMSWVGLVFAIVSAPAPFMQAPSITTASFLAAMHVVAGLAWFVGTRRATKG